MKTGYRGTFVISWGQTEVDGLRPAPLEALQVGVSWRWQGQAIRVDGPQGLLVLRGDVAGAELRRHAARGVRRLIGAALDGRAAAPEGPETAEDPAVDGEMPDRGFLLTDGRRSFAVTLIEADTGAWLLMFLGEMPEAGAELWVVRASVSGRSGFDDNPLAGGVICFAAGTLIRTESGVRPVETLMPGDRVLTRDDGPQEVLWTGDRRMTGARLYAMPQLRPIRLRAGALGADRPEADLLVSPQHRVLVAGAAARALFGEAEVLVAAKDLVDERGVVIDSALREVRYVHVLLPRHEVIWANGLETESFHPSNTSLETVNPAQREALLSILPGIESAPESYGGFARRNLTGPEAAILRHGAA
jgi:hypothetical protein